jgi:hypothetical protein
VLIVVVGKHEQILRSTRRRNRPQVSYQLSANARSPTILAHGDIVDEDFRRLA